MRTAALIWFGITGCTASSDLPALTAIEPSSFAPEVATPAVVSGERLFGETQFDLDSEGAGAIDRAWTVRIDDTMLATDSVTWIGPAQINVVVPAGLALGAHDVVAISPTGFEASLPGGLRVGAPMSTTDAPDAAIDAPPTATCPLDYTAKHNGHSYRRTTNATGRSAAKTDCGAFGHLVKIETAAEDAFSLTLATGGVGGTYVWIGLTVVSGQYQWDDGTPLGTYENFIGSGIPSPGSYTCVDKSVTNGEWDPFGCTIAQYGVCECDGL